MATWSAQLSEQTMPLTNEQLLSEVEDLMRTKPSDAEFIQNDHSTDEWCGRAAAVMDTFGPLRSAPFIRAIHDLNGDRHSQDRALRAINRLLHQTRYALRMETTGPVSTVLAAGAVFDYFDEVRKVIETAASDLLFVDPYLDAEFIARYLPHVRTGVEVRLLGGKRIDQLVPAAQAYAAQRGLHIAVRSSPTLHDRFVIVDKAEAYQSGASFKDGAKKSPTTLTQVTDAFVPLLQLYERLWQDAQVHVGKIRTAPPDEAFVNERTKHVEEADD